MVRIAVATAVLLGLCLLGGLDAARAQGCEDGAAVPCEAFVASVKTATGDAAILRQGQEVAAREGAHLYEDDVLVTRAHSTLGVIFRDDTTLSMGSNSELRIDAFVFNPIEDDMRFLVDIARGTTQFISGQMAKIAPDKIAVTTPRGSIGIRGTRFLVKVD
ncbi:MAG: FecR domain-containing protein [Desulfovibrionaceae bacterium]|nr:FecR domain-containing protein [Desulfovibrionaceae bacterium]